jgi:hypothetical protein
MMIANSQRMQYIDRERKAQAVTQHDCQMILALAYRI